MRKPGAKVALPRRCACGSARRGVTLVELLVALALSFLVIGALAKLHAANSSTRHEIERNGQQVESGRFALEILRDDVHHAGFYGGFMTANAQAVSPCVPRTGVALDATNLGWLAAAAQTPLPLHGYAAGDIPAAAPCIGNARADSDVLVVRSVDPNPVTVASAAGASFANDWYLQVSSCTNAAIDAPATPFVVAPGGSGAASRFILHDKDCATVARVRRLVVRAYYAGRCSVCSPSSDGVPSLRMVELSGTTATSASVVEGIEGFRVEYGFDLAGRGAVDTLRRCRNGIDPCTTADWMRLATVQVHVLARHPTPSPGHRDTKTYDMGLAGIAGPFNDGYKRHVYASAIAARNLIGTREQ
jgi:type IV pilus assembly protein PilW